MRKYSKSCSFLVCEEAFVSASHQTANGAERVQECRSSGLPVKMWCKEHGIKLSTFYTWQKKVFYSISTEVQVNISVATLVFAEISQALPVKTASVDVAATCSCNLRYIYNYDVNQQVRALIRKIFNKGTPLSKKESVFSYQLY